MSDVSKGTKVIMFNNEMPVFLDARSAFTNQAARDSVAA